MFQLSREIIAMATNNSIGRLEGIFEYTYHLAWWQHINQIRNVTGRIADPGRNFCK